MAKAKRQYVCQNCGSATYRWQGQCADCGEWNTLVEEAGETVFSAKHDLSRGGRTLALETLDADSRMPDAHAVRDRRVRPRAGRRVRRGVGDADRRRSGDRQIDFVVAGGRTAREGGQVGRLYQRRGSRGAGAVARAAAGARQRAGRARERDLGARYPRDARRARCRFRRDRFDPDDAQRPDRQRAGDGEPGPRERAGTDPLCQGQRRGDRARRPCDQGRDDRGAARARTYGRHRAGVRGRAQPPVSHPPRGEEPLRRHRRDRGVRDGRGRAGRGDRTRRACS